MHQLGEEEQESVTPLEIVNLGEEEEVAVLPVLH